MPKFISHCLRWHRRKEISSERDRCSKILMVLCPFIKSNTQQFFCVTGNIVDNNWHLFSHFLIPSVVLSLNVYFFLTREKALCLNMGTISSGLGKLHKSSNSLKSQQVPPCADFYVMCLCTDIADEREYLVNGKKFLYYFTHCISFVCSEYCFGFRFCYIICSLCCHIWRHMVN